ncbi:hypothetical protein [Neptunicella sp. SCSIO 80796]|uniref:hypothetical protein n=1 Tax=Neptunicella plasticusilytica TaxID=3117012 RepID=UPI003A4D794C
MENITQQKVAVLRKKLSDIDAILDEITLTENEWQLIESTIDDVTIRLTLLSYGNMDVSSEEEFDWL